MGAVFFYHLTERRLEDVLPPLLRKAQGGFGRVVLRLPDRGLAERLDTTLWQAEGFLAHGLSGGPHDDAQPILLTTGGETAPCLMSAGGAIIETKEAATAARVCILFDGHDAAAVASARDQWRAMTGAGLAAEYWADEGGWVKKAESAATTG